MGSDSKGAGPGFYSATRDGLDSYKPVEPGFTRKSALSGTNWTGGGSLEVSQLLSDLGGSRDITKPYQQSLWWYASVSVIAEAVRQAPLVAVAPNSDGALEPLPEDDPLQTVWSKPNPLFSGAKFWELLAINHKQEGETLVVMLKSDGGTKRPVKEGRDGKIEVPDELWPIRGALVEPLIDKETKVPYAWRVRLGAVPTDYPAAACLHIANANPYSSYRGQGAMTAALRDLAKAYGVDRFDEALLANGGAPGGVISSEQPLTPDQMRTAREQWQEANGRPDQHRKTAVLPNGMAYQQFGFSPKDMEFGGLREWTREGVLAVTGATKPLLGLTEGLNFASSVEARRIFWSTTVTSMLRFFEDELSYKFCSRVAGAPEGFCLKFDLSSVPELRADEEQKAKLTLDLMNQGGFSFAEAAALARWDHGVEIENADQRFAPAMGAEPGPNGAEATATADTNADTSARSASTKAAPPEADRIVIAKAHDEQLVPHEDRLEKRVKRHFRDYVLAVRKRVREVAASEKQMVGLVQKLIVTEAELVRLLDLNEAKFDAEIWKSSEPVYQATIDDFAKIAQEESGGDATLFTAADPAALSYIDQKKILVKEGWRSTLAKDLRKTMISTLATAPSNIGTLSLAIAEVLPALEDNLNAELDRTGMRARRIARTEINGAANFAKKNQWQNDGIKEHTWITARDGEVRADHAELDGKTVTIGDAFGHGLKFPGDSSAGASEVVNCRCTLIPEIPEN